MCLPDVVTKCVPTIVGHLRDFIISGNFLQNVLTRVEGWPSASETEEMQTKKNVPKMIILRLEKPEGLVIGLQ